MKQFEIRITIEAVDENAALEDLQQLFTTPASDGNRIWTYVKERVQDMEIEDVTDPLEAEDYKFGD